MSLFWSAKATSFGLAYPCPPFALWAVRARGTPRLGGAEYRGHWGVVFAFVGLPHYCPPPFLRGDNTSCIRAHRPPLPVLHIRYAQSVPPSSLPFQGGQWSSFRSPYPLAPPVACGDCPPRGVGRGRSGLRLHFPLPPYPPCRL